MRNQRTEKRKVVNLGDDCIISGSILVPDGSMAILLALDRGQTGAYVYCLGLGGVRVIQLANLTFTGTTCDRGTWEDLARVLGSKAALVPPDAFRARYELNCANSAAVWCVGLAAAE